uniref:Uncharacterized protein n=1 Tax=Myoviridae sp. ctCo31 TaxID=2825053 RepID=A0A8S5UMC4_9CAUD|nr:MAG TPA: hypothetical protein [Myoviridae sp. ctCo31]
MLCTKSETQVYIVPPPIPKNAPELVLMILVTAKI